MLTTLIVTAVVLAFTLIAVIGHLLLFTAVMFGRGTIRSERRPTGRRPATGPQPQLT
jgi:hypothetical protein